MAKKKQKQLTLQDGFDPVSGKFDTEILLKLYPDAHLLFQPAHKLGAATPHQFRQARTMQ